MRTFVLLVAYAGVLATAVAGPLQRADWVQRAPRLGILAWQSLSWSIVASVLLGGLALTVPTIPVASSIAEFVHGCVMVIQAQYATPGGAAATSTGLVLMAGVLGRVTICAAQSWRAASRQRRRQLDALALIGRRVDPLGVTLIDHDVAEVYCLPGRRGRIVLTTAALRSLDADQLTAVLAHERAHQRARHDLLVAAASGLARAFPRIHVFAAAEEETRRLAELAADDTAARHGDRLALAEGILIVGGPRAPAAALGAGSTAAATRVQRLLAPGRRVGALHGGLITAAIAATVAVPAWIAASPAVAAANTSACPLPPPSASATPTTPAS